MRRDGATQGLYRHGSRASDLERAGMRELRARAVCVDLGQYCVVAVSALSWTQGVFTLDTQIEEKIQEFLNHSGDERRIP
jgi:hypothetical protein